jgi:hypothetical protein
MNNEIQNVQENPEHAPVETTHPARTETPQADENEFQLTVRKLEMPVRPRGVLAE